MFPQQFYVFTLSFHLRILEISSCDQFWFWESTKNKILGLCRNLQGRYLKFLNEYNGIQSKVNYTNVTANYSSTGVESSQLLTTL